MDKGKVLIFAGTTEGRMLAEYLGDAGVKVHACVVTEYGRHLIGEGPNIEVSSHRLGMDGMCALMMEYPIVVDATHPYASTVTEHIKEACSRTGAEYIRLLRPEGASDSTGDVVDVPDLDSAIEFLSGTDGVVMATTGSKELEKYTKLDGYRDRVVARVLSTADNIQKCTELGFQGKNLICMQGPFSEDLNYAMLKQVDARYMVTKDSGQPGGFEEKYNATRRAGATTVLVGRPTAETGYTYEEVVKILGERMDLGDMVKSRRLTVVGIGMGTMGGMTADAIEAVKRADLLIGANRMLATVKREGCDMLEEYASDRILDYMCRNRQYSDIVVLVSGDVGFYSAARKLIDSVDRNEFELKVICGISSIVYLCSKMGIPWQDARLISAHGRDANPIGEIRRSAKVFSLLQGSEGAKRLCSGLMEYRMDYVKITIGEDLGSDHEKLISGHPSEVMDKIDSELCVALVENPDYCNVNPIGISDDELIRGDAPMTKSEIRSLSVSKLKLSDDSVVYDIGAGTGSVSVEMALVASNGKVYAIEKEDAASELIAENRLKFKVPNLEIIKGKAPDAMEPLPMPTHAFIGGSSGNMKDIIACLLSKNPSIRIVINTVTLESISESLECISEFGLEEEDVVSVSVAKGRRVGRYHLMTAQNPVYIVTCRGSGN